MTALVKSAEDSITTNDERASPLASVNFEHAWKVANAYAKSDLVPDHFKGKPHNVLVALELAHDLGLPPMRVLQNTYMVSGKPGFAASFMIGLANTRGPFRDPIAFEVTGSGDALSARAYATIKSTGTVVDAIADMRMAKSEGWTSSKKYQSMPAVMLRYRAATLLVRLYCPEVLLGLHTKEELDDVLASRSAPLPASRVAAGGFLDAVAAEVIDQETGEVLDAKSDPDADLRDAAAKIDAGES